MSAPTADDRARRAFEDQVRDAVLARAHVELGQEVHRIAKKHKLSLGEVLSAVTQQAQGLTALLLEYERRPLAPAAKKDEPKKDEPLTVLPSAAS